MKRINLIMYYNHAIYLQLLLSDAAQWRKHSFGLTCPAMDTFLLGKVPNSMLSHPNRQPESPKKSNQRRYRQARSMCYPWSNQGRYRQARSMYHPWSNFRLLSVVSFLLFSLSYAQGDIYRLARGPFVLAKWTRRTVSQQPYVTWAIMSPFGRTLAAHSSLNKALGARVNVLQFEYLHIYRHI